MNWFLPFSCLAIWGPLLQQPPARVFQIERWRTLLSIGVKNPNLCSNIHQYGANTTLKSDIDKASAPFHEACRTYLKLYSVKIEECVHFARACWVVKNTDQRWFRAWYKRCWMWPRRLIEKKFCSFGESSLYSSWFGFLLRHLFGIIFSAPERM